MSSSTVRTPGAAHAAFTAASCSTQESTWPDSVTDRLRLGLIDVTVRGDAVTLSGTVRSRADHDTALMAATAAPGVTDVHDEMRVMG